MPEKSARILPYDLGVAATDKKVYLYINLIGMYGNPFRLTSSDDGVRFKPFKKVPSITDTKGQALDTNHSKDFRISNFQKKHFLVYKTDIHDNATLHTAVSKDLVAWDELSTLHNIHEVGMIVPDFTINDHHVMYYGESEIKVAYSKDLKSWDEKGVVLSPHSKYFDKHPLEIGGIVLVDDGILVLYYSKENLREGVYYSIGAALFDKNDPTKLLWRRNSPVCTQKAEDHGGQLYPMGIIYFKEKLLMYFGVRGKYVFAVHYGDFDDVFSDMPERVRPRLEKHDKNPIMQPVLHHSWESTAAFNPAAVYDRDKVHIVYRAMGPGNTSVLGYASSSDGFEVDYRHPHPVYTPKEPFEVPGGNLTAHYMSGGGYGGCEDPRLTKIDDRFYLTYVAYDGMNPPRIAMSSIHENDFHAANWNAWRQAKLISPPGVVDKNCVIFPEKINGKYVIMHRVFPNILIDYLDDLDFENVKFLKGEYKIAPKEDSWDSRKVGAGAPPIKTQDGWLLIYHAVDDRNDSQYKIGAMLLDLNDPTKVLYRTQHPMLEPSQWYENHGFKAGVAYPCGAVVVDNKLIVYYGGADSYTCAASIDLDKLLTELKTHHPLEKNIPIKTKKVITHHA